MRETAALFRVMLPLGWIEPQQIVAWAGDLLDRQDDPHPALIDLALAGNASPDEMGALLGELGWGCSPTLPAQMLFAYILREYHAGSFDTEDIVPTLYGLIRGEVIAVPYGIEVQIDDLQQALDDAGHGDPDALDDIETDLIACLSWGDDAARRLPTAYL